MCSESHSTLQVWEAPSIVPYSFIPSEPNLLNTGQILSAEGVIGAMKQKCRTLGPHCCGSPCCHRRTCNSAFLGFAECLPAESFVISLWWIALVKQWDISLRICSRTDSKECKKQYTTTKESEEVSRCASAAHKLPGHLLFLFTWCFQLQLKAWRAWVCCCFAN